MTFHQRNLARGFDATHCSRYQNLLVSGCSYTYNNSQEHLCSWPYYLRDLAGFEQVLDASQSGSGITHAMTSCVYEASVNAIQANTLAVVMLSGLNRVDVITDQDLRDRALDFSSTAQYHYTNNLVSFSVPHRHPQMSAAWRSLSESYHKLVSLPGTVLQNSLLVIALHGFFQSMKIPVVFVNYENQTLAMTSLPAAIHQALDDIIAPIASLGEFADSNSNNRLPDGHPTPDAALAWTREIFIPYLSSKGYIVEL